MRVTAIYIHYAGNLDAHLFCIFTDSEPEFSDILMSYLNITKSLMRFDVVVKEYDDIQLLIPPTVKVFTT
jgi:hypothetical protein